MILSESKKKITSAKDITEIMKLILSKEDEIDRIKEHCWCVRKKKKNVIQYIELVSLETLTSSEVFRLAIMKCANNIFLVHNHPSGEMYPSKEDDIITKRIKDDGDLIGIKLLDHVIICDANEDYYSYQGMGKINQ